MHSPLAWTGTSVRHYATFYRRASFRKTRPKLLPPKLSYQRTPLEEALHDDPNAALLSAPLRQCTVTRRMQPSALMIRMVAAEDTASKRVWVVPDGIGGQPKRAGIGHWVLARRSILQTFVRGGAVHRISPNAFVRPDLDEFIWRELSNELAVELRRLVQSHIIRSLFGACATRTRPDQAVAGRTTRSQPNPTLFHPHPNAPFAQIRDDPPLADSRSSTSNNHSKKEEALSEMLPGTPSVDLQLVTAQLVVPFTSRRDATSDEVTDQQPELPSKQQQQQQQQQRQQRQQPKQQPQQLNVLSQPLAPWSPPVYHLDHLLSESGLAMVRTALGLRQRDTTTYQFALLRGPATRKLGMTLARMRAYEL